jgi:hypothetical protein
MAPAVAHFLVGASILLLVAAPFCLRYQVDREYGLVLVPVGGLWGITPDFHNIAPIGTAALYRFHNSPWVDLFGLHYTLDRTLVREQYLLSVFGAILLFSTAVAVFWVGFDVHARISTGRWEIGPLIGSVVSAAVAAGYATVGMAVVVGIQGAFDSVAVLVGSDSALVGGLLLVPLGLGLGVVAAGGLNGLVDDGRVCDLPTAVVLGFGVGIGYWLVGVALVVPLWLRVVAETAVAVPMLHWGSLVVCVVFGTVFGGMYGLMRGLLGSVQPRRLGVR